MLLLVPKSCVSNNTFINRDSYTVNGRTLIATLIEEAPSETAMMSGKHTIIPDELLVKRREAGTEPEVINKRRQEISTPKSTSSDGNAFPSAPTTALMFNMELLMFCGRAFPFLDFSAVDGTTNARGAPPAYLHRDSIYMGQCSQLVNGKHKIEGNDLLASMLSLIESTQRLSSSTNLCLITTTGVLHLQTFIRFMNYIPWTSQIMENVRVTTVVDLTPHHHS